MTSGSCLGKHCQNGPFCSLLILAALACIVNITSAAFCAPIPNSDCWPTKSAFAVWLSKLGGRTSVFLPERNGDVFLAESTTMNTLKSSFPSIIVVPGTESDLRLAIKFAVRNRIRILMRCSGNDFNGRSTGRGAMIIKTSRLNNVSYASEAQTVTFSAGATHADIYSALAPYGRLYVGAQSKGVCAAGCLAGGCHSVLSRQYGLGIDSILKIRFMLFNGTMLTLNRTSNDDLFHAFLGAGQNAFGVAVSFTARTYPAPARIYVIDALLSVLDPVAPDPDQTWPNLMSTFFLNTTWFDSMPRELAGNINVDGGIVSIKFFYSGLNFNSAFRALQPLLTSNYALHVEPAANYTDMYQAVEANTPPVSDIWARKFITNGFVPAGDPWVLDALATLIVKEKPRMRLRFVFGGAVAEGTIGTVPSGMRTAMYEAVFDQVWFDPAEDQERMQYVSRFLPDLYDFAVASYSNEFTSWSTLFNVPGDWKIRFFSNYDWLLEVKDKYDPCNLFTAKYGVGSDLPQATCEFE
ncbi:hypothetical protein VaNZ11_006016 [Volvox africanus]|uniref:FAD-binding PCMH-type domain-containing protein n=1 Tax=Volvox africanus TaxID=51714 RepID=A0ABQ5S1H1_9CHLO|nr:hypothetical protein VaNZ11_006016 [Volvox africanus]